MSLFFVSKTGYEVCSFGLLTLLARLNMLDHMGFANRLRVKFKQLIK
jgi:hypothetical protein